MIKLFGFNYGEKNQKTVMWETNDQTCALER